MATQSTPQPVSASSGLLAGAVAGACAAATMLLLAPISGVPSLAEVLAESIAGVTPISIIEHLTGAFGSAAKRGLFAAVLMGQVALGAGLGLGLAHGASGIVRQGAGVGITAAMIGLVLFSVLGGGLMGANTRAGTTAVAVSLAVGSLTFLACYRRAFAYLNPTGLFAEQDRRSRRAFLRNVALTSGAVWAGATAFRWAADVLTPRLGSNGLSAETEQTLAAIASVPSLSDALQGGVPGLAPEITRNDKFYVVSKNVMTDPNVNPDTWRLEISGAVERPAILTYAQLKAMPAANQFLTLQCIGNPVGGNLIGNAEWRGVPVNNLLRSAGVRPTAIDVIFRAADDYSDSVPIAKAMEPGTMLAYEMNGQVLPKEHGFPTRLLLPDIYGMKNVKWVTRIEVVEYDYRGYWQDRGWSDVATMQTGSRIDFPKPSSVLTPGANYVGGIALAGARGIHKVEVSTDGGQTWAPAVSKPPLGPYTWLLWLYEWELRGDPGTVHQLMVRATDGRGVAQITEVHEDIPDGATGLHAITVTAAA